MKVNYMMIKESIATNSDIDEYLAFESLVKSKMTNPEWLGSFSKEKLEYMINNGYILWLSKYYLDIISTRMLIPSTKEDLDIFGIDLDYMKTIEYGPMMVDPNYWGNKLQQVMLQKNNIYSKKNGYTDAIVTVHPDNVYSKNNLFNNGFSLSKEKEFERGKRLILSKKL